MGVPKFTFGHMSPLLLALVAQEKMRSPNFGGEAVDNSLGAKNKL